MKIIEVNNLIKKYKKATSNAVDDISFNVNEGEFFAFLGPNGAGKTTTISILTTTLSKTSGNIKIAGFDVDKEPESVRKSIGVIFQNPSLDVNLTAEENVRFHAILYKLYPFYPTFNMMPDEYKNKIHELSEVIGLKENMFKPVKTFSGGMKRKLEIMRTLIHKPKVLFLDEPTSGLDPLSRRNLWEYIKKIRKEENTTIFLTTHYLEEAEDADNVCIINHGKIVINNSLSQVKSSLVKDYVYVESALVDKDKLANELESFGYTTTKFDNGYKIFINNSQTQDFIKQIQTKLPRINIVQPTLEDAYLDIIEEKE